MTFGEFLVSVDVVAAAAPVVSPPPVEEPSTLQAARDQVRDLRVQIAHMRSVVAGLKRQVEADHAAALAQCRAAAPGQSAQLPAEIQSLCAQLDQPLPSGAPTPPWVRDLLTQARTLLATPTTRTAPLNHLRDDLFHALLARGRAG